ncbi:hypothetical protein Dimus_018248 [Dionaea muscipula]
MRLASILGVPDNNGICEYIKEVWEESKYTKPLEITIKFANDYTITEARRRESGSDDQFYNAQVEVEEPVAEALAVPVFPSSPGDSTNVQKEPATAGVDPLAPTGRILDSIMSKLQADFKRARAYRIQADLEKAQAENAKLLALLQQAQS